MNSEMRNSVILIMALDYNREEEIVYKWNSWSCHRDASMPCRRISCGDGSGVMAASSPIQLLADVPGQTAEAGPAVAPASRV